MNAAGGIMRESLDVALAKIGDGRWLLEAAPGDAPPRPYAASRAGVGVEKPRIAYRRAVNSGAMSWMKTNQS